MRSEFSHAELKTFIDRYAPRWGEALAARVYTSRLLGRRADLVLHGGGNTSLKTRAREMTGAEVDVLYVKGSGWDLGDIEPEGFPACRLEPLLALGALSELSDQDMVLGLRSQMLNPSSPTPSVEALLHALIPAQVVDHTHANAVLAVVDQPDGEARAREVWGDELLFVPYVMPGFVLAKAVAERREQLGGRPIMVLDKHGIFTWGSSAEESYERMIAAVTRAEEYLKQQGATISVVAIEDDARQQAARERLAPIVRGALSRAANSAASNAETERFILEWRREPELLDLLARRDAAQLTQIGTITPDHVIRTKRTPMWLDLAPAASDETPLAGDGTLSDAALAERVERALDEYTAAYHAYFERHVSRYAQGLTELSPLPTVVAVPGLGALCAGKTLKQARVAGDVYVNAAGVISAAANLGEFRPTDEGDLFDVEYWSLEQAKLAKSSAQGVLLGRVALVTGAASGIGLATATHFLELGAHVVLCDARAEQLESATKDLRARYGVNVASRVSDVTRVDQVDAALSLSVSKFGGIDIVVSNAGNAPDGLLHTDGGDDSLRASIELNLLGHQNVAKAASKVLLRQGVGGCLLFNASKSAFNPGPKFGPYAVAKAGLVALMKQYAIDLGPSGIRTGAINADRIRTALFSEELLNSRARARGVSPDEYFRTNLLARETTAGDVARGFAYLATAYATTGVVLTVDGGNPAAFPR